MGYMMNLYHSLAVITHMVDYWNAELAGLIKFGVWGVGKGTHPFGGK